MSQESFETFRETVLADAVLQAQFDGIEDNQLFVTKCIELAARSGIGIDEMDVYDAMNEGRRAWIEQWI